LVKKPTPITGLLLLIILNRAILASLDVPYIIDMGSKLVIALSVAALILLIIWGYHGVLPLLFGIEIGGGMGQVFLVAVWGWNLTVLLSSIISMATGMLGVSIIMNIESEHQQMIEADGESEYVIEVEDVYKDYVVGNIVVHALRGISMRVRRGEFVAIMGPSGSGKSTLLNLIGALDKPTSGKIYIDGVDISKLDEDQLAELRNRKIGFVFQMFNLINRTSVARNVELPSIITRMPKKKRIEKVRKLLSILGLDEDAMKRRPIFLSGGQQQRVAIARALMNDPKIILADEPTGNLDSKTGKEVMEYLKMLNRKLGTTVVVVTHDRSVAMMADRILHIMDGKIIREEYVGDGYGNE